MRKCVRQLVLFWFDNISRKQIDVETEYSQHKSAIVRI